MSNTIDDSWMSNDFNPRSPNRCDADCGCNRVGKFRMRRPNPDSAYTNIERRCRQHLANDLGVPMDVLPVDGSAKQVDENESEWDV